MAGSMLGFSGRSAQQAIRAPGMRGRSRRRRAAVDQDSGCRAAETARRVRPAEGSQWRGSGQGQRLALSRRDEFEHGNGRGTRTPGPDRSDSDKLTRQSCASGARLDQALARLRIDGRHARGAGQWCPVVRPVTSTACESFGNLMHIPRHPAAASAVRLSQRHDVRPPDRRCAARRTITQRRAAHHLSRSTECRAVRDAATAGQ